MKLRFRFFPTMITSNDLCWLRVRLLLFTSFRHFQVLHQSYWLGDATLDRLWSQFVCVSVESVTQTSWTLYRSQFFKLSYQGKVPGDVISYCFWWKSGISPSAKPEMKLIFTARGSYASAVLRIVILSVCLSVSLSHACFVTTLQNISHERAVILVFWH